MSSQFLKRECVSCRNVEMGMWECVWTMASLSSLTWPGLMGLWGRVRLNTGFPLSNQHGAPLFCVIGPIPMSGLTDSRESVSPRSREIIKALGLSQCQIPKGVRIWVHTYRALSVSLHQCRLYLRELPTVQSVVTFTAETIGKSGN